MSTLGVVIPVADPHMAFVREAMDSAAGADHVVTWNEELGPRVGEGAARNFALAECFEDWVFFLDADDMLLPGAIEAMRGMIDSRKADVYYAPHAHTAKGNWRYDTWDEAEDKLARREIPNLPVNILVPRVLVEQVGGYDESLNWGVERDMLIRLALRYRVDYFQAPLVHIRSEHSLRRNQGWEVDPGPFSERVRTNYYGV